MLPLPSTQRDAARSSAVEAIGTAHFSHNLSTFGSGRSSKGNRSKRSSTLRELHEAATVVVS